MIVFEWDIPSDRVRRFFSTHEVLPVNLEGESFADVLAVVYPEDRDRFRQCVQTAIEDPDGVYEAEFRVVEPDGKIVCFHEQGRVERDADGRPVRIVGVSLLPLEQRLYATLDAAAVGIAHVGLDGRFLWLNRRMAEIVGYTASELLQKTFGDITHPEDLESDWIQARRLMAGEIDSYAMEKRYIRKDGSPVYVLLTGSAVRNADGSPSFFVGVVDDISERKQTENALRQSEERFRVLVEAGAQAVWEANPQGLIQTDSPSWRAFTGQSVEDFYRNAWDEVLHPHDRKRALENWAEAIGSGNVYRQELRVRRADQTWGWTQVVAAPIRDEAGRIVKWVGMNTDINDRKEAERRLAASEWFHRQTLESIPGLVFTHTCDGMLDYFSAQWAQVTGLPIPEQLGMGWVQLLHPDDVQPAAAIRRAAMAAGREYALEFRLRGRDGEYEWFQIRGRPIRDDSGKIVRWFGMASSVDELKQAETDARRSRDELELRVRQRTAELHDRARQLASLASQLTLTEQRERRRLAQVLHDHIQQLLVSVKFRLQLLARRVPKEYRSDVAQVDALLTQSITASRSLTVELSPPILHEGGLVPGLQWLARWMKETHDLQVEMTADESVRVDREDLRLLVFQAVRELLFNVVKHAGTKQAKLELRLHDGHLNVRVSDQGSGFQPEKRIGTRSDVDGVGFGLFSIQERLELLGGALLIDSAPTLGTECTLRVPLHGDEAAAEPVQDAQPAPADGSGRYHSASAGADGERIRLLLVDDHAVMRQGLHALLCEEKDIEIVGEAANGVEAVQCAQRLRPDVILMDFSMPRMDGVEATRIIHSRSPDVRIIGLSMYAEADRASAMLQAGASAYVQKTGQVHELLQTIRRVARMGTSHAL